MAKSVSFVEGFIKNEALRAVVNKRTANSFNGKGNKKVEKQAKHLNLGWGVDFTKAQLKGGARRNL